MMNKIDYIIELAKKNPKKIVLPEANDDRILEAAKEIKNQRIADVILLNHKAEAKLRKDFSGNLIVPAEHPKRDEMVRAFCGLNKHKGMTEENAKKILLENPLYFAAMMVHLGMADSFVAGATCPTRDVIRAAMQCLGINRSIGTVFGAFLIEVENRAYGADGLFIFADCAVIPLPTARQLVKIAISSGELLKRLFNTEPRIAFLTYSSHGSAEGESIDRAREALAEMREKKPDFIADGELQLDAAIIPDIQKRKAPGSPLEGKANILVFPSLDAGNITYKAIERLGNARAVGPILLGLNKPCSDLSRGCDVRDIIAAVALTSLLQKGTLHFGTVEKFAFYSDSHR